MAAFAIVATIARVIVGIIGYVERPEPSETTHSGSREKAYVAHRSKHGVNLGGRDLDCQALLRYAVRFGRALGRFGVMLLSGFQSGALIFHAFIICHDLNDFASFVMAQALLEPIYGQNG